MAELVWMDPFLIDSIEVIGICEETGLDQATVIGHLFMLWAWADRHTYDGSSTITKSGLARMAKSSEQFIDAAASAGLVEFTPSGSIIKDRGRKKRRLNDWRGVVYFILAPAANLVKIGFTASSVQRRLEAIQTAASERLQILAAMKGGMADEKKTHQQFKHLRSVGEWFRYEDDLRSFVEGLR
jgi:hypothetical protein